VEISLIENFISVGIVARAGERGSGKIAQIPEAPRVDFCASLQSENWGLHFRRRYAILYLQGGNKASHLQGTLKSEYRK
jgi:hypothetical protein